MAEIAAAKEKLIKLHVIRRNYMNTSEEILDESSDCDMQNNIENEYSGDLIEFICDICDSSFSTAQARNEHIEQHFQMIECPNCLCYFYGDRAYEYHTTSTKCKKVVKKTKFRCNICNVKVFDTLDAQKKHEITEHNVHIDNDSITCDLCARSFAHLKYLKKHISELHLKTSQHVCGTCGKHFNRKSNFVEHMLIHENKYLSKCDICNKSYRTPSALKLHKRMHTGEKPYTCNICLEKSYAYNTDLKRHKRTSHGIVGKPFPCEYCTKVYYEPKLLKYHMKKHHTNEENEETGEGSPPIDNNIY